jgi:hypothetical protein
MRNLVHFAASLVMWGVFGYYWSVVFQRGIDRSTLRAVEDLAIIVLAGLLATLLWVRYNLRVARRDRRRVSRPAESAPLSHDTLLRPIVAPDVGLLRRAASIEIRIDAQGRKTYAAGGLATPESEP